MSGTTSGNITSFTVKPTEQHSVVVHYNPNTIYVANNATADGAFVYVWIYPGAIAVTPVAMPLPSGDRAPLPPPQSQTDPSGKSMNVATLVIYNTGGVELTVSPRND